MKRICAILLSCTLTATLTACTQQEAPPTTTNNLSIADSGSDPKAGSSTPAVQDSAADALTNTVQVELSAPTSAEGEFVDFTIHLPADWEIEYGADRVDFYSGYLIGTVVTAHYRVDDEQDPFEDTDIMFGQGIDTQDFLVGEHAGRYYHEQYVQPKSSSGEMENELYYCLDADNATLIIVFYPANEIEFEAQRELFDSLVQTIQIR